VFMAAFLCLATLYAFAPFVVVSAFSSVVSAKAGMTTIDIVLFKLANAPPPGFCETPGAPFLQVRHLKCEGGTGRRVSWDPWAPISREFAALRISNSASPPFPDVARAQSPSARARTWTLVSVLFWDDWDRNHTKYQMDIWLIRR